MCVPFGYWGENWEGTDNHTDMYLLLHGLVVVAVRMLGFIERSRRYGTTRYKFVARERAAGRRAGLNDNQICGYLR